MFGNGDLECLGEGVWEWWWVSESDDGHWCLGGKCGGRCLNFEPYFCWFWTTCLKLNLFCFGHAFLD